MQYYLIVKMTVNIIVVVKNRMISQYVGYINIKNEITLYYKWY